MVKVLELLFWGSALVGVYWAATGQAEPFGIYEPALVTWATGGAALDADSARLMRFFMVPLGATMAGYFVLAALVVRHTFPRDDRWAWRAMAWSLAAWFVVDTSLSIAVGAWFNVWIVNVPYAVLVAVALAAARVGR